MHKYNSKKYIGNEENDVNITQTPKDSNNKNESIDYMNNSNKLWIIYNHFILIIIKIIFKKYFLIKILKNELY